MKTWILRYSKAREKPNESRHVIVLLRTGEGEVTEIESSEIQARNENLPDLVEAQVNQGRSRVILDLASEKTLDSNELAQLIGASKYAKEAGGELVFANPNPRVREILRITHLDDVMPLYDSIAAAAEHFSDSA